MSQETITPTNHGVIGAAGHTVAGAAGGAVKSGLKGIGYTALIFGAVGAAWATGGLSLLGGGLSATVFHGVLGGLGGALIGGALIGPFVGMFTGTYGAAKGGSEAAQRVREEKGAANMVKAQLQAMQFEALNNRGTTNIYAPTASNDNKYDTASTLTQAPSTIQQGQGAQFDGVLGGPQLAAAR